MSLNSKNCKSNSIYFSIKGKIFNGNNYIDEAIRNGANTIISDLGFTGYKKKVLYINSKNPNLLMSYFANKIYKLKPKNIVGVTGTNGKSSVADFYYQILKLNNYKSASVGTLGVKSKDFNYKTTNTTVDIISMNKILSSLKKSSIDNVILEASSHGLQQNRLEGINFSTAIFTNFSRDHLDYHISYKNYLNSKLILFKKLLKKRGLVIFDNEIKEAAIIKKISNRKKFNILSIGKNGDLEILEIKFIKDAQKIKFMFRNKIYTFTTKLIGKIQIKNLLMAVLAASRIINMNKIVNILKNVIATDGRFEKLNKINNNSKVILDYAHTPNALETCIQNIKDQFRFSKISILFGCGGDRDKPKRKIMGRIANKLCDKIFLTDDNPRAEDPNKIRGQIKKGISKLKLTEIPSRQKAIKIAINSLKSGDILLVSGKGHENYQEYKTKKYFSDKKYINKYIKIKNLKLSKNWKTNIVNENINKKFIDKKINIESASINSKEIKSNQIFFGIKGKKFNGNKFANEAVRKPKCFAIVDKIYKNSRKIFKVQNSLNTFSKISSKIREVSNINAIAITGSAGKTSVKELIGQSFSKIINTTYSIKSYNNKFGVPISLFEINNRSLVGVFEVGMDKKGEILKLSNLIKPDIGIITNISYAHIKNFKSLKQIANAKSELIYKINKGGTLILNKDDQFFYFFKKIALKKKLNILSFSKRKGNADLTLHTISKRANKHVIYLKFNGKIFNFFLEETLMPFIDNILITVLTLSLSYDLNYINKNIFLNHQIPDGRGNIINLKNKNIKIFDETYNSNPLSMEFSIKKFDKIKSIKSRKILILGDMLELGKFSKKLHIELSNLINNTNIDKVYVYGNYIRHTFNKIKTQKRGKLFKNTNEIIDFINNHMKNGDNLMIKASNAIGFKSVIAGIKTY